MTTPKLSFLANSSALGMVLGSGTVDFVGSFTSFPPLEGAAARLRQQARGRA